ncbi:MAG: Crp/Fnr family transcriptional regulator [Chloroflexales bacterium]|nr:Crp/Fnr family transcriptional regulator [Chloroflexales bacterium]
MAAPGGDESAQQRLTATFTHLGTIQSFRRHSYVYTPGQPAHALYLLKSGQVNLQMHSPEGRVLTVKVVEPGQIFGHSALDGGDQYDTFAQALQPVRLFAVPRVIVLEAVATTPGLGADLIDLLGQHRLTVGRRLDEVAFKSVPARLASVLLEMSEEQPTGPRPQQRVARRTHQQLAEMVNAYRETVTKIINQFRDARLLDVDRSGITLLNPSRLRELSQS